ncbi:hypothetical protein [Shimia biformata]|uniref:hypothetical protein n=1 Tax=Shimia biformata TaxID=1294299 RepID=UPI00194DCCB1|nr:hypothetical protein [Shimia biformata]
MKVHILDDWFDTLRRLPCFDLLSDHEVTVWIDHIEDVTVLAKRLQNAETVVLFRAPRKVTRDLLECLPKLRLISQRGVYPRADVVACSDNNVLPCSRMPADAPMHKITP